MKFKVLTALVVTMLISCHKKETTQDSINGNWQSIGSGWVLQIKDSSQYSLYNINSVSCLPKRKAKLNEIITSLSLKNDTLALTKGIMNYSFTRIATLPEMCTAVLSEKERQNPLYNFEVFATTVQEHYAFMDLNNIYWPAVYERQKQRLKTTNTEVELYKVLEETLELLNDNHAYLEATDEVYEQLEALEKNDEASTSADTPKEYGDFQIADMVAKHHIVEDMTEDSWLIKWGKLTDSIGFIEVKAMWLYADLEIPKELIENEGYVNAYVQTFHEMDEGSYIEKEVAGVRKIMDRVMTDLKATKAIVLDLRFNGGGQDAVNFEILKRFNSTKRQVVATQLKHKNSFSPLLRIQLDGAKTPFDKPIFVLTSQQTGSAAEAFAIGTMALPNARRIGRPTQGALSTALEKNLPNGWVFSISNEIYMDNAMNSYENIGVPVDYKIDYPSDRQEFFRYVANDLDRDKANILTAIAFFMN